MTPQLAIALIGLFVKFLRSPAGKAVCAALGAEFEALVEHAAKYHANATFDGGMQTGDPDDQGGPSM